MFDHYFSSMKEMQEQLFRVLAIAACLANTMGLALNFFLHGKAFPTYICIFCGIIIVLLSLWGFYIRKKMHAVVGILITVVWIEFPLLYLIYNNIILIYFILSVVAISIYLPQKFSIPFCITTIIWDIIVIAAGHYLPLTKYEIEPFYLLLFTICSYLIVAIACFAILSTLIVRYEKQKADLQNTNEKLNYLAHHDPLTQLYNREYLINEITRRIKEPDNSFIAVIMDIDDFKHINDTYGHTFGDTVLSAFARLITTEIEGKGFAARFGGEEFMLIYDNDDKTATLSVLESLAIKTEEYFMKEHQIKVTFSGGLERYSGRNHVDELILNADNKLYRAKREGKNRIIY